MANRHPQREERRDGIARRASDNEGHATDFVRCGTYEHPIVTEHVENNLGHRSGTSASIALSRNSNSLCLPQSTRFRGQFPSAHISDSTDGHMQECGSPTSNIMLGNASSQQAGAVSSVSSIAHSFSASSSSTSWVREVAFPEGHTNANPHGPTVKRRRVQRKTSPGAAAQVCVVPLPTKRRRLTKKTNVGETDTRTTMPRFAIIVVRVAKPFTYVNAFGETLQFLDITGDNDILNTSDMEESGEDLPTECR